MGLPEGTPAGGIDENQKGRRVRAGSVGGDGIPGWRRWIECGHSFETRGLRCAPHYPGTIFLHETLKARSKFRRR